MSSCVSTSGLGELISGRAQRERNKKSICTLLETCWRRLAPIDLHFHSPPKHTIASCKATWYFPKTGLVKTPKCHSAHFRDPRKGTPKFEKLAYVPEPRPWRKFEVDVVKPLQKQALETPWAQLTNMI